MTTTEHHWAKIRHPDHGGWFWVSIDAFMRDGIRIVGTPAEAQTIGTTIGGRLLTAREADARWLATSYHNYPVFNTQWLLRSDGYILHSRAYDEQLAQYEEDYGEPLLWIRGNCGKPWVSDKLPSGADALVGGYYDVHTRPKRVAPVYPDHTPENDDAFVIQRKFDSSHRHHKDYSSTMLFARDTPPECWREIGTEGYVVTVWRGTHEGSSEPNVSAKPLRLRALEWSLSLQGHREQPMGSNTSPLIDKWAERCTRKGHSMGALWNAYSGHHWCALFATGGAHGETLQPGDPEPPCGMRISGKELIDDARDRGTLVTPDELFAGLYELRPGDIIVYKRLDPKTGRHTWHSHVCRFVEWKDRSRWLPVTVDGNSANMVRLVDARTLRDAPGLWGVIRYFDDEDEKPQPSGPESFSPPSSTPAVMLSGIDVSHHQLPSRINWGLLAQDNQFVLARCSYGTRADQRFAAHIRGARSVGMSVGAYHFYRHNQHREAQLGTILAQLEAASFDVGDIVPAIDLEHNTANDGPVDPSQFNDDAQWLAEELKARNGEVIVYTERDFWRDTLGSPDWVMRHPVWTSFPFKGPPWPDDYAIWQHSHTSRHVAYPVGPLDANWARRLPRIS